MTTRSLVPEVFAHLVDLAADSIGGFALYATDDYFAAKERLLFASAPQWLETEYTDKGKWMDGWESQRRRTPGHDSAIIRLGLPGRVHGALVDTTHFKGNAPQQVALEGIDAPWTSTAAELLASDGWKTLADITAVKPDHPNVIRFDLPTSDQRGERRPRSGGRAEPLPRVTHVRLRIFPDGGVARLRIYGEVVPDHREFWRSGSVDLAAVENGGTCVEVSDQFFGPPSNLLLPGRGVNMGDGWETKRRRTPGSDWAVIRLGRRGVIDRVELDTHFFKGNAPQACLLEALDITQVPLDDLEGILRSPKGWQTLIEKHPLVQHRRHQLDPIRALAVTHVRVHIFPHGGVNRLRLFGHALDSAEEIAALDRIDAKVLESFCGSTAWVAALQKLQPFASVRTLFAMADDAWFALPARDWLEAYAAHPRIGDKKKAKSATSKSAAWSKGEQAGVGAGEAEVKQRLKQLNDAYFKKFGFIYIVCATGRTAPQLLEILEERIRNSKKAELEHAAREQAKITRLRIEKWLAAQGV
jgi:allantoicase